MASTRQEVVGAALGRLAVGYAVYSGSNALRAAAFLSVFQSTYNSNSNDFRTLVSSALSVTGGTVPSRLDTTQGANSDTKFTMALAIAYLFQTVGVSAEKANSFTNSAGVANWFATVLAPLNTSQPWIYTLLTEYASATQSTSDASLAAALTTRVSQEIGASAPATSVPTTTNSTTAATGGSASSSPASCPEGMTWDSASQECVFAISAPQSGMSPWVLAGVGAGVLIVGGALLWKIAAKRKAKS